MNKSRALRCLSSDKRFGHVASHSYLAAQKGQRITRDHGAAHKPAAFHNLALSGNNAALPCVGGINPGSIPRLEHLSRYSRLLTCWRTAAATASAVMPKCRQSSSSLPDAPKLDMPMKLPSG